jgi:predicted PhzF superfamily epimerase YddE/YHI9
MRRSLGSDATPRLAAILIQRLAEGKPRPSHHLGSSGKVLTMRSLSMFQVDAFAERLFAGNPAAVLILDDWLDDALMQAIAAENNLAETAFACRRGDESGVFDLRWFTPTMEVPFCGHATLATAHVLATAYGIGGEITFATREVGILKVRPEGSGGYTLDLPSQPPVEITPPAALPPLFPAGWHGVLRAQDNVFVVLESEAQIRSYRPDDAGILALSGLSLCITAPGEANSPFDFVSRFFAPGVGIPEDPVTGSIHASLTPYWAERLGRTALVAFQASRRGGRLDCRLADGRVLVTGHALTYMEAQIVLPADA